MANTFNGIGTTFYGKKEIDTDDSFVTTKWFVIGYFPIAPLGSYRLRSQGTSGIPFLSRTTSYEVLEQLPLNLVQVLFVYAYSIFIVFWTGHILTRKAPPLVQIILIVTAVAVPFLVRALFGQKTESMSSRSRNRNK